jgi:hypothetical protein
MLTDVREKYEAVPSSRGFDRLYDDPEWGHMFAVLHKRLNERLEPGSMPLVHEPAHFPDPTSPPPVRPPAKPGRKPKSTNRKRRKKKR